MYVCEVLVLHYIATGEIACRSACTFIGCWFVSMCYMSLETCGRPQSLLENILKLKYFCAAKTIQTQWATGTFNYLEHMIPHTS